jgi:hypothetical protein
MDMRGLGDVLDPSLRRTIQQGIRLGRSRWIVRPEWIPTAIPELQPQQKFFEDHALPRLWQLLADYQALLQKGTFRIQKPGWIEPPFGCEPEDLTPASDGLIALANGTPVTIISYQVPDRHVASFPRFGHMLDVAAQWGTVTWTIQVNEKPIRTYQNFKQQRGTVVDPTPMAKPIVLGPKAVLKVTAIGGATPVNAFARLPGWVIPVSSLTQDGTAIDWNVR